MKELLVSTKDLTKKFGEVVAVDKVSMEIYSGEIRGLIGENGSGKSTISQMICGIYSRTSGEIFYKYLFAHGVTSAIVEYNISVSQLAPIEYVSAGE